MKTMNAVNSPDLAGRGRLITVSNRLPVVLRRNHDGSWEASAGSGGLVTALVPVLRDRGGLWIGWPGVSGEDEEGLHRVLKVAGERAGYELYPVILTAEEEENFYFGFSNQIVWPMFHDLHTLCNFSPVYWNNYRRVNRKFAQVVAGQHRPGDYVWIHDYHLMCVAGELKNLGVQASTGFFLHIPFPPLDIFLILPWRLEILKGILDFDFLGFQTQRDMRNFLNCVETLVPDIEVEHVGRLATIRAPSRQIRVGYFPISIDYQEFARTAADRRVAEEAWLIHENLPERKIILGIDRLDYTKGIPYRLDAFRETLNAYPELHGKVSLVQVVVPSREDIPEYHQLREEVERLVGQINGQFTESGWVPIHYICRNLRRLELLAYYRTAEIALVTPLKDGMNLVAKEYCACKLDENGVLILSEFAGAADQLQDGALLVNPVDIQGVARAIHEAIHMSEDERKSRMRKLRQSVKEQDIFWWVDSFLSASIEKTLTYFPLLKEYVPQFELD